MVKKERAMNNLYIFYVIFVVNFKKEI
jgi:hypothetical protein